MENVDEITNLFEMMFVENPPEEMEINVPVDTSPNPLNDLNSKSFKSKRIVKPRKLASFQNYFNVKRSTRRKKVIKKKPVIEDIEDKKTTESLFSLGTVSSVQGEYKPTNNQRLIAQRDKVKKSIKETFKTKLHNTTNPQYRTALCDIHTQ